MREDAFAKAAARDDDRRPQGTAPVESSGLLGAKREASLCGVAQSRYSGEVKSPDTGLLQRFQGQQIWHAIAAVGRSAKPANVRFCSARQAIASSWPGRRAPAG